MGCIHSKRESDNHPNIYRVVNVDSDGIPLWSGTLEISPKELTLYRKGKEPTKWALQHLRRYGFDADLFTFEAGRRCTTGQGIFAFRCRRAESLFHLLQSYIQGIATHDENTSTGLHLNDFVTSQQQQQFNTQMVHATNTSRSSSGGGGGGGAGNVTTTIISQQQLPSTNYVNPSNRNTATWNTQSTVGFTRSTDTLTGDYLDPTPIRHTLDYRHSTDMRLSSIGSSAGGFVGGIFVGSGIGGPLSPIEPNSPGSPNSFNVILEVTQLNEYHQQAYQNSNLYQEFPLRSNENNNNFLSKKLSLDIPPQEPAPAVINNTQPNNILAGSMNKINDSPHINPDLLSPLSENDADRPYVNITPGEKDSILGTPTTTQVNFIMPRLSTSTYSFEPANRCYENLDLGGPTVSMPPQITRLKRYSKPDIFGKMDLQPVNSPTIDNSEPSTPTSTSSLTAENHKVNYIVLDLDQFPVVAAAGGGHITNTSTIITKSGLSSATGIQTIQNNFIDELIVQLPPINSANIQNNCIISNSNNFLLATKLGSPTATLNTPMISFPGSTTLCTAPAATAAVAAAAAANLLPPESPKKASLGYATIDFNKTAALSNSAGPSLDDSEGSRKTRHSVSVRQTNSTTSE